MPRKPLRPCNNPGCRNLVEKGYCAGHEKERAAQKRQHDKRYNRERGSAAARGYGGRWRKYRAAYLAKHPLCMEDLKENKYEPSIDVDHIIPVEGPDDPLFWDEDNHQALCHSCHSRKTWKENRR